jgi:hypothetical protein
MWLLIFYLYILGVFMMAHDKYTTPRIYQIKKELVNQKLGLSQCNYDIYTMSIYFTKTK